MEYVKKIETTIQKGIIVILFVFLTGLNSTARNINTTQLQEIVNASLNYFKTLKPTATIPSLNLVLVSTEDWPSTMNKVIWDFEAGYVEGNIIYVTEPILQEQKEVFPDIESVIRYTIAKEMISKICNNSVPNWFLYGYAAYEARLSRPYESIRGIYTANNSFPSISSLTDFHPESDKEQRDLAFSVAEYCLLIHGDQRLPYTFKNNGEIEPFTQISVNDTWQLFLEKHYLESEDQVKLLTSNSKFAIYGAAKDQVDASSYLNELSSLLNLYESEFKLDITRRVDILINPDKCTQLLVEGWDCDSNEGGGGHGNGLAGCAFISNKHAWYRDYIGLMLHEFTHVYQFWLKSNFMPAWLSEGFASRLPGIFDFSDPFNDVKIDMFNKWTIVNQNLGRYPTMAELMDYGFVRTNKVDYYTIGALMVEYILQKGGYQALREIVESNGLDFKSMGYNSKEAFLSDFYFYFDVRIMEKNAVDLISPLIGTINETEILNIDWTTAYPEISIKLEISFDDGNEWETIVGQTSENSFNWSVPDNTSSEMYLRFSVPENLNVSSVYGPFKIQNNHLASLELKSPIGGEYFVPTDTTIVRWNSNSEMINILCSTNNGSSWSEIATNIPAGLGVYKWKIPDNLSENCLIKLVDGGNETVFDKSKKVFEIGEENKIGGPYKNDKNTVLLLHGEGNSLNQSEFSNNASFTEGKVSFVKNEIPGLGKAFLFNTSNGNSQLTIPHTNKLSLKENWTIELWFKPVAYNQGLQYFVWKPGDHDEYFSNYSLQLNGYWENELYAFYFSGDDRIGVKNQFYPTLNVWYHITYIRDLESNKLKLIIRDSNRNVIKEELANDVSGNNPLTSLEDLLIGSNFTGYIDEVRISNIVRNYAPTYNTTSEASICVGETYQFGTQLLSETGEYMEEFKSISGSDSTVILTLTVSSISKPTITSNFDTLTCNLQGQYEWFLNSVVIEGANSQNCIIESSGDYQVIVSNSNGCESPISDSKYVVKTTIENLTFAKNFVVFPNPTRGKFTVKDLNISNETTIQIFDTKGTQLYKNTLRSTQIDIDITGYTSGLYNLVVSQENSRAYFKIVKK